MILNIVYVLELYPFSVFMEQTTVVVAILLLVSELVAKEQLNQSDFRTLVRK